MAEKSGLYNLVVLSGPLAEFSGLMFGISELTADNPSLTKIVYSASLYYIGRLMTSDFILERLSLLETKLTEPKTTSKTE